jgi:FMN phosphatase YigB (HAD superfamily)
MIILGVSGKAGSGKDHLASCLVKMLPPETRYLRIALADHFKVDAVAKSGLTFEEVFVKKTERSRSTLQQLGTEQGRQVFGKDIWCRVLAVWIRALRERMPELAVVFVTDVRFPDEIEALRALPDVSAVHILRVEAPQRHAHRMLAEANGDEEKAAVLRSHVSETALDSYEGFDLVLANDPNDDAITELRDFALEKLVRPSVERTVFVDLDDTICQCQCHYDNQLSEAGYVFGSHFPENRAAANARFTRHFMEIRHEFEKDTFSRDRFARDLQRCAKLALADFPLPQPEQLLAELYRVGMAVHDASFNELPGARTALQRLVDSGEQVVIFTVGERADQLRKLLRLGLASLPCETFIRKDFSVFKLLMHRWPARSYAMIGDSWTRDIEPAQQAGIDRIFHLNSRLPLPSPPGSSLHTVPDLAAAVDELLRSQ